MREADNQTVLVLRTSLFSDLPTDATNANDITAVLSTKFDTTEMSVDVKVMQPEHWDKVIDALISHDKCVVL